MKRVLLGAVVALLTQAPTIDWSHTVVVGGIVLPGEGPGGSAALQLTAGASGATSFHLATIAHPSVTTPGYALVGMVRYQGVEGQGYIEMWSVFPDGQRFFTRTLAPEGALGAIHGESSWRPFALPFHLHDSDGVPSSLEVNVVLPGRGTVWLGPLRLERTPSPAVATAGEWWSQRSGALGGVVLGSLLGLVGALIGGLGGTGRARAFVVSLLTGMVWVGGALALAGAFAVWSSQPRHVWYPLLMLGGVAVLVGSVVRPAVRRRFAADELRRMAARDVGARS